jgi:hypothetical protein
MSNHISGDFSVLSFYVMSQFWHPSTHIYKLWVNYITSKICTERRYVNVFFKYSDYKREEPYRSEVTASPNTEQSYGPVRDLNGFASGDRTRPCLSSRWLLLMNRPLFLSRNETASLQRTGQGDVSQTGEFINEPTSQTARDMSACAGQTGQLHWWTVLFNCQGPKRLASEDRTRPCLSNRWLLLMNRPLFLSGNETASLQRIGQGDVSQTGHFY